jgi:hypothetical protein
LPADSLRPLDVCLDQYKDENREKVISSEYGRVLDGRRRVTFVAAKPGRAAVRRGRHKLLYAALKERVLRL